MADLSFPCMYLPTESPEQLALGFYISHILPHRPGYLACELPKQYALAGSSSLLAKATSVVALNYLAIDRRHARYKTIACTRYAECLSMTKDAIQNPETQYIYSDEFIMGLLLLFIAEASLLQSVTNSY